MVIVDLDFFFVSRQISDTGTDVGLEITDVGDAVIAFHEYFHHLAIGLDDSIVTEIFRDTGIADKVKTGDAMPGVVDT